MGATRRFIVPVHFQLPEERPPPGSRITVSQQVVVLPTRIAEAASGRLGAIYET
jgi:hypothetical protein